MKFLQARIVATLTACLSLGARVRYFAYQATTMLY